MKMKKLMNMTRINKHIRMLNLMYMIKHKHVNSDNDK